MSGATIAIVSAIGLSAVAIIWATYVLLKRANYTREKFAFTALATFTGLCGTIISALVGKQSPWTAIANFVRSIRGLPKELADPPRIADHVLLIILITIIAIFIYRIFSNWGGALSADEEERRLARRTPALMRDGLDELGRVITHKPRRLRSQECRLSTNQDPITAPSDALEWHAHALDLVTLRWPSYRFSRTDDFHPEARCWIGIQLNLRQTVAVFCPPHIPADQDITAFMDYVQAVKGRPLAKNELLAIVAVRDGVPRSPVQIGDFVVQFYSEASLLDDLVDFSDYFDNIIQRVEIDHLPDSARTLSAVYAPSQCRREGAHASVGVETVLQEWLAEGGQRQLALLGEYGQGKSTRVR